MRLPVLSHPIAHHAASKALTFERGLLLELISALKSTKRGELFSVAVRDEGTLGELDRWCALTGNALVERAAGDVGFLVAVRNGPLDQEEERPLGSRVWLYTNFDCNLACDYCCVRSSPRADPNALGVSEAEQILGEVAAHAAIADVFLTGGEPFLREDIGAFTEVANRYAPTTILTNGMLFAGRRRAELEGMSRERTVLQVSLDSPDSGLHDLHRGKGSFRKAMAGIETARGLGFRVRLAATVSTDADEARFRAFLDAEGIADNDRLVRRVALRGFAEEGLALSRAEVVPEVTFTRRGVYFHPVGATDDDFLVTEDIFPVANALKRIRDLRSNDLAYRDKLASIFHCA